MNHTTETVQQAILVLREYVWQGDSKTRYFSQALNVMENGVPHTKAHQHTYLINLKEDNELISVIITVTNGGA